jgi:hypothetical protein
MERSGTVTTAVLACQRGVDASAAEFLRKVLPRNPRFDARQHRIATPPHHRDENMVRTGAAKVDVFRALAQTSPSS